MECSKCYNIARDKISLMPISADEFDKEIVPKRSAAISRMILEYLQNHKTYAFAEDEVASYLYPNESLSLTNSFKISSELIYLDTMQGKIESKGILAGGNLTKYYEAK